MYVHDGSALVVNSGTPGGVSITSISSPVQSGDTCTAVVNDSSLVTAVSFAHVSGLAFTVVDGQTVTFTVPDAYANGLPFQALPVEVSDGTNTDSANTTLEPPADIDYQGTVSGYEALPSDYASFFDDLEPPDGIDVVDGDGYVIADRNAIVTYFDDSGWFTADALGEVYGRVFDVSDTTDSPYGTWSEERTVITAAYVVPNVPTLWDATGSATGETTASGAVLTDVPNGSLSWEVLTTDGDLAASGNQAIVGVGVQFVSVTGLSPGTDYYFAFQHTDAEGDVSNTDTSETFTTEGAKEPLSVTGLRRLIYQYQHSPLVKAFLSALLAEYDALDAEFTKLRTRLDIDASEGAQLEGIGEIVGQPRPAIRVGEDETFAFDGAGGLGFSSLEAPETGGVFVSLQTVFDELSPVSDADYRRVLRAAIVANYSNSNIEDLIRFCNEGLGVIPSVVNDVGHVTLTFSRPLLEYEVRIIDRNLPITAGARYTLVS